MRYAHVAYTVTNGYDANGNAEDDDDNDDVFDG